MTNNNSNPDPFKAATDALLAGNDIEAAVYGTDNDTSNPPAEPDSSNPTDSSDSSDDTSTDDAASAPAEADSDEHGETGDTANAESTKERIPITDHKGRREIEIDYSDREKIKRAYQKAAGGQKWKVEKDKIEAKLKEIEPKHNELSENWNALESAYKDNGIKGVVELIAGEEGAYDKHIQSVLNKHQKRAELSDNPEALEKLDLQEQLEQERQKREQLSSRLDEVLNKASQEREESEAAEIQSRINPHFNKHRFAGTLNDPDLEHQLDDALWNQALRNLENYSDDEIYDNIEQEFKRISDNFRKAITKGTKDKVKTVVKKRANKAKENAATRATKANKQNKQEMDMTKQIQSGDYTGAFRGLFGM